jgi:hypothetical protein
MMVFATKKKQMCGQGVFLSFVRRLAGSSRRPIAAAPPAFFASKMLGWKRLSVNRPLSLRGV